MSDLGASVLIVRPPSWGPVVNLALSDHSCCLPRYCPFIVMSTSASHEPRSRFPGRLVWAAPFVLQFPFRKESLIVINSLLQITKMFSYIFALHAWALFEADKHLKMPYLSILRTDAVGGKEDHKNKGRYMFNGGMAGTWLQQTGSRMLGVEKSGDKRNTSSTWQVYWWR